ncbi:cadherin-like domain-containing protein, partial [Stutzerimonas stutzeri]
MAVTLTKVNAFSGAVEDQYYAISYSLLQLRANESSNTDGFLLSDGADGSLWYKNADGVMSEVDFSAGNVVFRSAGLYINNVLVTGSDTRIYWLTGEHVQGGNVADAFRVQAIDTISGSWGVGAAGMPVYEVSGSYVPVAMNNITPVNDAPKAGVVTLSAIAEDSGARLITSAELLAAASDADGDALTVSSLQIASGNGVLVANGNGTWSYTPALDDDTSVTFSYVISDGALTTTGTATLDITPVDDTAPNQSPVVAGPVTLDATEDGNPFVLDLLQGATDANGDALVIIPGVITVNGQQAEMLPPGFSPISENAFTFDPAEYGFLAEGEIFTIVLSYAITDGNGGSVNQVA